MQTQKHGLTADLFREMPRVAADLVGAVGVPVSALHEADVGSERCPDNYTKEYSADAFVKLKLADGDLGVIIEMQQSPDIQSKRWTWPFYLAQFRVRHKIPTALLVIAPDPKIARKCAEPIDTGHPGYRLVPKVLQPHHIPVITDPREWSDAPHMNLFCVMFHGAGPEGKKVLEAAAKGIDLIAQKDRTLSGKLYDFAVAMAPEAVREDLEALLKSEYRFYSDTLRSAQDEGRAEGRAEGELEAMRRALLTLLEERGAEVTDEHRRHIDECTNLRQLQAWLIPASRVSSAAELFD